MSIIPVSKSLDEFEVFDNAHAAPKATADEVLQVFGQRIGFPADYSDRARTWLDRIEAFVSRLSVRDNFWQRICSLIWLPYAFFSGIKMRKIDANTFSAVLPFTRFNRNWYRAMAGGALLGNSEIAGGMYVFGVCGANYTVVCKHLEYKFLRPCFGPAVYKMRPREDIKALLVNGDEFNLTLDMDVLQQMPKNDDKDRRVGKCVVTFHVTPKAHLKAKASRSLKAPPAPRVPPVPSPAQSCPVQ